MGEPILKWCMGNVEAAVLLGLVFEASQVADDIVDGDAKDQQEAMARLLSIAFVEIPDNKFYQQHGHQFRPLFATSIQIWSLTDQWKQEEGEDRPIFAYVWREILEQVAVLAAYICGGQKHARTVANEMNKFYHAREDIESFSDWIGE
jgi:hypothetical protein